MSTKKEKLAATIDQWRGRAFDPHYVGYFECFNRGQYYEAHDVLEQLWLQDRHGAEGSFYKGLIQLAGAFVHLQKGRLRPAAALFKLAEANFRKYPARHRHIDLGGVIQMIDDWLKKLEASGFKSNPLASVNTPKIQPPA